MYEICQLWKLASKIFCFVGLDKYIRIKVIDIFIFSSNGFEGKCNMYILKFNEHERKKKEEKRKTEFFIPCWSYWLVEAIEKFYKLKKKLKKLIYLQMRID